MITSAEYVVVSSSSRTDLEAKIVAYLLDGWDLCGGVSCDSDDIYYPAVSKIMVVS